jgi:competence protein ComEA
VPTTVTGRPEAILGGALLVRMLCAAAPAADLASELARESQSMKSVCGRCHDLQIVRDTPRSYDEWHDTVQKMVDRGANGTDEQFEDIMDYLHRTVTTIDVNTADAPELKLVLNLPKSAAQAIIARRSARKFSDLNDLKSIPGVDALIVDSKVRLIFFR